MSSSTRPVTRGGPGSVLLGVYDGYFPPDSLLRRVISETLVALSAPQVLLLQAAHPVAWAGFFAHTGASRAPV